MKPEATSHLNFSFIQTNPHFFQINSCTFSADSVFESDQDTYQKHNCVTEFFFKIKHFLLINNANSQVKKIYYYYRFYAKFSFQNFISSRFHIQTFSNAIFSYYVSMAYIFYFEVSDPFLLVTSLSQNCPCTAAAAFAPPGTRCGDCLGSKSRFFNSCTRILCNICLHQTLDCYCFLHLTPPIYLLLPLLTKLGF